MPETKECENHSGPERGEPSEPKVVLPAEPEGNEQHVDADRFHSLDAHIVRVWQLENMIACGIMGSLLAIAGIILWWLTPFSKLAIVSVWSLALILSAESIFWWPKRCYARWSYRLAPLTLELRHGVVWHSSVLIPLTRVQHVDLHRSPFERRFGLASLEVHTAGTRNASHRLPGLDVTTAESLRDRLVASANLRHT